jgi:flagellar biosynthesis/type III secretory pathway M-ring protein FliF/YscJ
MHRNRGGPVIVIGAVFLVLAALGVAAAVVTGRDVNVHLDGFGVNSTVSVLWVFCAGALAMLFLLIALAAFRRAARRRRAQRRELKQLRSEESAAAAAAETRAAHREDPVDLRDGEAVDDSRTLDDPGPERRYVPGETRS